MLGHKLKNTFILSAALIVGMHTAFAQKVKESEVVKAVTTSFQTNFKGAKVEKWEKESNGIYIAEFKWNKNETSAKFTSEGRLMNTEQEMKISDLSSTITDYISKNYSEFKIRKAKIITAPNAKNMFKAQIKRKKEKWNVVFDADGNFIKKESTEPEEEEKD